MERKTKKCPACGEEIMLHAIKCKYCGEWLNNQENSENINNTKVLPVEYRKFNWGAFLLTWIWGIGNRSYVALWAFATNILCLIPFVGWIGTLAFAIWLGTKGNELAWQNQSWKNLNDFNETQRKWAMWSCIAYGILFFVGIIFGIAMGLASLDSYY